MEVLEPVLPKESAALKSAPRADFSAAATNDFGTLGPGSDLPFSGPDPITRTATGTGKNRAVFLLTLAILIGLVAAYVTAAQASWSQLAGMFRPRPSLQAPTGSLRSAQELDKLKPQGQAEALLELAVGQSDGAVDQITSRVDRWQGKLKWTSQMSTLTTAALNSSDMRVRESGVEVELAAYGLAKNQSSLDYLLKTAESPDHSQPGQSQKEHAQKVWALWALGLMGNRGVEPDRVVATLKDHLKDADEDSRRWAVEGLALVGSDEVIPPLLTAMHDDHSAVVRERAACGLAESGMFTPEQRMSAVPQLLAYTDDPALDVQTKGWAFQALSEITHQRLPNDAAAWRSWYENRN